MRHMGELPVVPVPDEGRSHMTALRFPSRTEDLWSPTPLSLASADRLAALPRSNREPRR